MRPVILSKRLQMLADMVSDGNRLVDVGCDHGFLSIWLVQQGKCPRALAMDVRPGPLAAAKTHVEEAALADYIETRISDGLKAYCDGEAQSLVCAGMGGPLMEKILTDSYEKARNLKELILQPQSEIREFREFLRKSGFRIVAENAVIDEGKYYFAMKAVPDNAKEQKSHESEDHNTSEAQHLYDTYGEFLLKGMHPVLHDFLKQRFETVKKLEQSLTEVGTAKAMERMKEVREELGELEAALAYFA